MLDNKEKLKILIVDDDLEIQNLLSDYLDKQGYSVTALSDGTALDQYLKQSTADVILLDLMMPGEDGLSIVKRLSGQVDIPIIMLSACGEDMDKIIGLEVGADDYLAKPFNPRELLARIRSVLRRNKGHSHKKSSNVYQFGPFTLDSDKQALLRDNETIALTSGEFSLLQILVKNSQRVLSRDSLLEQLKGYDCSPFDRSIDVRIMRLRQKIEIDSTKPIYIKTIWGKGYQFMLS